MKKTILALSFTLGIYSISQAQNVNIPDVNFKAYLVGNTSINTNSNTEISMAEAAAYNAGINCAAMGITDLTGIEAFTGYITLNCSSNQLTSLNLTANTHLGGMLEVGGNPLTSLLLPPNITSLKCQNTQLTSLDLSNTPGLTQMWSMMTPLTSINFTNSSALIGMNIDGNHLTTIDLSNLTNLEWLNVTQSTLTAIDISPCTSLASLNCDYSDDLTELNLANGNNMSFAPNAFSAQDCPLLTCVTVDNVSFANAVWTSAVDAGVSFSLDCSSASPLATSLTIAGQGGVSTITSQNGTLQMVPTVLPVSAQGQNIFWGISSGASLASVNASGLVTALDNGVVTIGALTSDGSNISATTNITISNQTLGLNSLLETKFTVYPNPAITSIFIQTDEQIESVTIYSSNGNFIQSETTPGFSIEHLNTGIYFLKVITNQGVSTARFMKN